MLPPASRCGSAACTVWKTPSTLVFITARQSAAASLATPPLRVIPALATTMSIRPNRSVVSAISRRSESGSRTSVGTYAARSAWSATRSATSRAPRAPHMTRAPAARKPSARWRPSPVVPPVTTAVIPRRTCGRSTVGSFGRSGPTTCRSLTVTTRAPVRECRHVSRPPEHSPPKIRFMKPESAYHP